MQSYNHLLFKGKVDDLLSVQNVMPQKIKSLLYLSCFIIAAFLYYNIDNTSSQNDEMVDTHNTHIDEITISSFDDDNNEVEEDEEDEEDEKEGKEGKEGKEYSD